MKSLVSALILGVALLCCASPILADEASKAAKIDQMMQLTHYDRMMKQTLEQMKNMQLEQIKKSECRRKHARNPKKSSRRRWRWWRTA